MVNKEKRALRRPAILKGISQNQPYKEIADKLEVSPLYIYRDINSMRYARDPDLIEAQRMGISKKREKQALRSKTLEEDFSNMTGMSIKEKSFENMVHFYKDELMFVLGGVGSNVEIKKLPLNTRRAMMKAGLLNWKHTEITQKALDYVLAQILEMKSST